MSESARSDFHFDLTDRVVLVTGAARGLGACIAKRAAAGGARLLLGDIRDAQGEAVAKKIGGTARYLHLDVALEEDWTRWVDTALSEWGRIDALVNNAAILHIGTVENTPADVVLHLGDVALGPIAESLPLTAQLHGRKFLVPGNHDRVSPATQSRRAIERFAPLYEQAGWIMLPEIIQGTRRGTLLPDMA